MICRVVTYVKATERMKGNLPIPPSMFEEIKRIAGFGPQDDGTRPIPARRRTDKTGRAHLRVQPGA